MTGEHDTLKIENTPHEQHELMFVSSAFSAPKSSDQPNEDTLIDEPKLGVYAVFDGMGGYEHGERASHITRDLVLKYARQISAGASLFVATDTFTTALEQARDDIRAEAERLNEKSIGTTGTILFFQKDNGVWRGEFVHVGDSRIYRMRQGRLQQITTDHDVMYAFRDDLAHNGVDPKELAHRVSNAKDPRTLVDDFARAAYDRRHIVHHSIGTGSFAAETGEVDVVTGDIFIVCTDGVSDNLTHDEIEELGRAYPQPALLSAMLVQKSQEIAAHYSKTKPRTTRAKPDDMTAVVVAVN